MFAHTLQCPNLIVHGTPLVAAVRYGVVFYYVGCHVADEFLVFELVEREAIASLRDIVVLLDICNDATTNLQLYVGC